MASQPPSEEERFLISQLRERVWDSLVTEEQKSDPYLLRWIRARDGNLDKAEELLRNSLKWRSEHGLDTNPRPPVDIWFTVNFPHWLDYSDKWGHPVLETPLGAYDLNLRPTDDTGNEIPVDYDDVRIDIFESVMEAIKAANNPYSTSWPAVTQFTIIVDFEGFSYSDLLNWRALQNPLRFAQIYEEHYPMTCYKSFMINCPAIFPLFFAMYKKVAGAKTLERVYCYKGEEEWKPVLLEEIGEDMLPQKYGGKRIR